MDQAAQMSRDGAVTSDRLDVYKLRAGGFHNRYEGVRNTAWKVLFQTYTGYVLIVAAFSRISGEFSRWDLGWAATGATALFFGLSMYLWVRMNERLRYFHKMYEAYMQKLHELTGAEKLEVHPIPKAQHKWGYVPQIILSIATLLCLLAYIWLPRSKPC